MDERVARWLRKDPDGETREELRRLVAAGDAAEVERRFARRLAFGTAGLRGLLGAGPARMNRLVVRETTAGLAAALVARDPEAPRRGVVVGYDARRRSDAFAEDAVGVLAALGFRVYAFDRPCPTPLCAFAVVDRAAAAGVVVTASHNPPEYNGYKVYADNGAQIVPPDDEAIARRIDEVAAREEPPPWIDPAEAARRGLVERLGDELVERYLAGLRGLSIHPPSRARERLSIAYTPLHGVGGTLAARALEDAGFRRIAVVTEQAEPDPDFPTVPFPNPEEPGAMDAVLALGRRTGADLVLANDPDADRLAAAVRRADGGFRVLTGDELGVLLGADRIAGARRRVAVVTTIVSSRMLGAIARATGTVYAETLTGFKWIANRALAIEREQGVPFAFGYEEALGYMVGTHVRDKDGISALVALAEMAAALAEEGTSLLDALEDLYRRYGVYVTAQKSLRFDPALEGPPLLERLRARRPAAVAGRAVRAVADYGLGERTGADGRRTPIDLPRTDAVAFELDGAARVVVRPSGTEPKIKCYYELRDDVRQGEPVAEAEKRLRRALDELVDRHQHELAELL